MKPHSALRGAVPGASGPAAAVFILQTHPNRMDQHDPTAPVLLSTAAQYSLGPRFIRGDIQSMERQSKYLEAQFCLISQTSIF